MCTAAFVGNPNAGKSGLFNTLTGAGQKIANHPGCSGEQLKARWSLPTAPAFLALVSVSLRSAFRPSPSPAAKRTRGNGRTMLLYLFALAYSAAGLTYWTATALGL